MFIRLPRGAGALTRVTDAICFLGTFFKLWVIGHIVTEEWHLPHMGYPSFLLAPYTRLVPFSIFKLALHCAYTLPPAFVRSTVLFFMFLLPARLPFRSFRFLLFFSSYLAHTALHAYTDTQHEHLGKKYRNRNS